MKRDKPPNPLNALTEGSITLDVEHPVGFVRWRLVPLGDQPDPSLDDVRLRIPRNGAEETANE